MVGSGAGHNIARLIFAKRRESIADFFERTPLAAGQRHFGQGHKQATVGNVMHRIDLAVLNELTDKFCVRAFLAKVDRWCGAVFTAMQFAQP